jgi:hypothetical protein
VWEAQLKNIEAGRWCPTCAKTQKRQTNVRHSPDDYHAAAAKRGFIWLGPEVPNAATKTQWQCPEGHIWQASYLSICHVGSGCPYCAGIIPLPPSQFRQIALERGFEWLGPVCSYREKTQWRCPNGHTWWAQYGNIRHLRGCPECSGGKKEVTG